MQIVNLFFEHVGRRPPQPLPPRLLVVAEQVQRGEAVLVLRVGVAAVAEHREKEVDGWAVELGVEQVVEGRVSELVFSREVEGVSGLRREKKMQKWR